MIVARCNCQPLAQIWWWNPHCDHDETALLLHNDATAKLIQILREKDLQMKTLTTNHTAVRRYNGETLLLLTAANDMSLVVPSHHITSSAQQSRHTYSIQYKYCWLFVSKQSLILIDTQSSKFSPKTMSKLPQVPRMPEKVSTPAIHHWYYWW